MTSNYYDIRPEQGSPLDGFQGRLRNVTWSLYSDEWNCSMHSHRHAELFFILGGRGEMQLRDRSVPLAGRDLVVVNPGVFHGERSQCGDPLEYIVLGVENLELLADDQGYIHLPIQSGWESLTGCLRLMLQELRDGREGCGAVCQHMLEVILLQLLRQQEVALAPAPADPSGSRECDLVRRYIDDHFKEPLTLDQLSKLAHINKYYLVHAFRKEYGTSPISYQIARRIQESKFLLASSDHALSQIAHILGFSSLSYFSQSFRRAEGMSPLEYRKGHRREEGQPGEARTGSSSQLETGRSPE